MASPQPGIFIEGAAFHHFLEYTFEASKADTVNAVLSALRVLKGCNVNSVIAFGPELWTRLRPDAGPDELRPFTPINDAPATQRDLFIWLHGAHHDDVLDAALAVHRTLAESGALDLDERGFVYHDSRDLTGFIDGTANPKDDARMAAALVPGGQAGAGGAYVLTQKWVHDLDKFGALPVTEQERVIGRTKPDSIELTGAAMPPDSHVARTDVKVDGVAYKMYRRSAPIGSVLEHGLYFLAFACDPIRFDVSLQRMFGASEDGVRDRITEFSTPVSGSYWFAPSREDLDEIGG
jgi:porphyrinogen peroxidase